MKSKAYESRAATTVSVLGLPHGKMKVLVVGAGSIGARHAKILDRLVAPEILVVDPDDGRRAAFLRAVPARPVESLDLALEERPDAAIICSPTLMHVSH